MKMTFEHYEHLRQHLAPLDTDDRRRHYADQGMSSQRYRWMLVKLAGLNGWVVSELYPYIHDGHIETALRRMVPTIHDKTEPRSPLERTKHLLPRGEQQAATRQRLETVIGIELTLEQELAFERTAEGFF